MGGVAPTEELLRRIEWVGGGVWLLLTFAAWAGFSGSAALSVFLGGGIVIASFEVLKWQLKRALMREGSVPTKGGLFFAYYLRYLGTLLFIFLVISFGWVEPIAFLVGLSTVVISIFMVGGLEYLVSSTKRGER